MRVAASVFVILIAISIGCAPDVSDTAFRCDDAHACPDEQTCVSGRCRRGGVVGRVQCGDAECDETEQCCAKSSTGNRCIPAGEICDGTSALCDGLDDCQAGDQCCAGDTIACGGACDDGDVVCTSDDDCPPGTEPFCCEQGALPFKRCKSTAC